MRGVVYNEAQVDESDDPIIQFRLGSAAYDGSINIYAKNVGSNTWELIASFEPDGVLEVYCVTAVKGLAVDESRILKVR